MSEIQSSLEILESPEIIEWFEEADLRVGILMSVGTQGSVSTVEEVFSVLPDGLEPVVDRVIRRPNTYTDFSDNDTTMFDDYIDKDERAREWIIRFADGSYELTDVGIMEYMRMTEAEDEDEVSPLNKQIHETIELRLSQKLTD